MLTALRHKNARRPSRDASGGGFRRHRGDLAFGLIEVMVALMVLLIAIVPLDWLIVSITHQASQARAKVAATGVAEKWLEYYNTLPLSSFPADLPATVPEPAVVIAGATYHTTVQLQWAETGLSGNLCTPGSTPQVISAISQVTWGSANSPIASTNRVQEQTVINPPYGLLQPNSGFLALQVDGASGPLTTPVGQTVTATVTPSPYAVGGSTAITVPAGGCIFTTALKGTYTVSLSSTGTASPYLYVDSGEHVAATSKALTVANGATTSYIMTYDEGGAIGLSYPSASGLAGGLQCPTASKCFAWGYGAAGNVQMIQGSPGGSYSAVTLPAGVSAITDVSCETSSNCYFTGIGASNSAVLLDDNSGTVTAVTLPGPATELTSVACLNTSTCYATGTDGDASAVLVSIAGTTAANALPALTGEQGTLLASIECSNSNNCIAVGSGITVPTSGTGTPNALVLTTGGTNWAMSPVPAGPSAASEITCDTNAGVNPPICVAAIQDAGTTVMTTADDGATWAVAASFPTGYTAIGPMACTGATNCTVALQQVTATATTATTASTVNGTSWSIDTGWQPPSLQLITGLTCPSSTACLASGVGSGGAGTAVNTGLSTTSAGSWSVTSSGTASYFAGIGCVSSTACIVTGGSDVGPVAYVTSDGGSTWSAPGAASGFSTLSWSTSTVTGLPITVSNGLLTPTQVYQAISPGGATIPTLVPNLFPFTSTSSQPDYSLWAGDTACLNEVPPSTDLVPIPVTSGTTSSALVPLTLLPIAAVRPNGTPVAGAAVSLTVSPTLAAAGCPSDAFGVPATTSAGLAEVGIPTSVPVGGTPMAYTVTVSAGGQSASAPLAVNATGITNQTTGVTYPYPSPVPFVLNMP